MTIDFDDLFLQISTKILKIFPSLNIYTKKIDQTNERFILIDDEDIYFSDSFQELITVINTEILWKQNIHNIYFSYDDTLPVSECIFKSVIFRDNPIYSFEKDEYNHPYSLLTNFEIIKAA